MGLTNEAIRWLESLKRRCPKAASESQSRHHKALHSVLQTACLLHSHLTEELDLKKERHKTGMDHLPSVVRNKAKVIEIKAGLTRHS